MGRAQSMGCITSKQASKEGRKEAGIDIRAPRIELGTYCVLDSRHNQLDQARGQAVHSAVCVCLDASMAQLAERSAVNR